MKLSKSRSFSLERVQVLYIPADAHCKAEIKWLSTEWHCWINNALAIKSAGIADCCEQLYARYPLARWEYLIVGNKFRFIAYN